MFRLFSQDNDKSDDRDETQPEEAKKDTPPSKKSKSKKPSKGDEDHEAEEEKNKDDSIDMESQKEDERTDVEMHSQTSEHELPDPEESKEKNDEKVPTPDFSRRAESTVVEDREGEDVDGAVDSEESRSSSAKDEAKSPLAQMATAGGAGCLDKDTAEMDDSMEVGKSAEAEGVEGDPVPKDKLANEENETSSGEGMG
ncbi:hypothetical protein SKAU_G00168470 [Synaphobranchus kaupii]|uniref:Uncharacterized protein n=1 Tax=Synaphobranchus kaupii TaxID=118154 RepID=A0A9Q1FJX1_SYNKA|nr:hypothetical protein SKAU_G00168470 [Synaphobranchus kaupii]